MPQPARYDFLGKQGNTLPIVVRVPFDCTGDDWVLCIVPLGGGVLRKAVLSSPGVSLLALTNISSGGNTKWQISCTLSAAETRSMPVGTGAVRYELERRSAGGEQRTYIEGRILLSVGINDEL